MGKTETEIKAGKAKKHEGKRQHREEKTLKSRKHCCTTLRETGTQQDATKDNVRTRI